MATQMHPRLAKRMPCNFACGERRHKGLVLNVSQGGLFVQTNATMPAGEPLDVTLSPAEGPIPVHARVVWKRVVPSQLRTSAQGGLGMKIEQADERYFQQLAEWMRVEDDLTASRLESKPLEAEACGETSRPRFYVRVLEQGRTRSRRFEVDAESSEAAQREALDRVGTGWRVIEVKRLAGSD